MLRIRGGDFGERGSVELRKAFTGRFTELRIMTGFFSGETISRDELAGVEIITAQNEATIGVGLFSGGLGIIASKTPTSKRGLIWFLDGRRIRQTRRQF